MSEFTPKRRTLEQPTYSYFSLAYPRAYLVNEFQRERQLTLYNGNWLSEGTHLVSVVAPFCIAPLIEDRFDPQQREKSRHREEEQSGCQRARVRGVFEFAGDTDLLDADYGAVQVRCNSKQSVTRRTREICATVVNGSGIGAPLHHGELVLRLCAFVARGEQGRRGQEDGKQDLSGICGGIGIIRIRISIGIVPAASWQTRRRTCRSQFHRNQCARC
ncbi:hypothetical protein B0H13DRAFT_1925559 [Mycena leptocephala]|nr:hypothetical protein B0H13DRAFT_1925559 [Mycena leptocephala]